MIIGRLAQGLCPMYTHQETRSDLQPLDQRQNGERIERDEAGIKSELSNSDKIKTSKCNCNSDNSEQILQPKCTCSVLKKKEVRRPAPVQLHCDGVPLGQDLGRGGCQDGRDDAGQRL